MYYLAGPYSIDPGRMYEKHKKAWQRLYDQTGATIFSPVVFLSSVTQGRTYGEDAILELCLKYLRRCDGLIRLPGKSPGSDLECQAAAKYGIQIWDGREPIGDFVYWYKNRSIINNGASANV